MVDANVLMARLSKLDEYVRILVGLQHYTQTEFLANPTVWEYGTISSIGD